MIHSVAQIFFFNFKKLYPNTLLKKMYSLIKLTKVKTCIPSFIKCIKSFKVQLDAKEWLFPFQNQINKTEASDLGTAEDPED